MSDAETTKPTPHHYSKDAPPLGQAKGKVVTCQACGHTGLVSPGTEVATCSCCGARRRMR
jgi:hypothetical protein